MSLPERQGAPRRLAMFPLSAVLFPNAPLPLHVFESRYRALVADVLEADREFGVVLIARGSEVGGLDERFNVGTVARIGGVSTFEDGRLGLLAKGTQRIHVTRWMDDDPYPMAEIEDLEDGPPPNDATLVDRAASAVLRARTLLSELGDAPALPPGLELGDDPMAACWRLCALAPLTPFDDQRLLELNDTASRLTLLAELTNAIAGDLQRLLAGGTD